MTRHAATGLAALCLALLWTAACERVAPIRTLPSWVQTVYVPMVLNRTYEPGLEEKATQFLQEAFLADGRLIVGPKRDADVIVRAKIISWTEEPVRFSADKVAENNRVTARAAVMLYEPYDPTRALADLGVVEVSIQVVPDPRSIELRPEPERIDYVLNRLAEQIVNRTLTGFPTDPPGGA